MGQDVGKEAQVLVRSGSLLFWVPAENLTHIMSGYALKAAQSEEDPSLALLEERSVRILSLRALLGLAALMPEQHALILTVDGCEIGLLVEEALETADGLPSVLALPEQVLCPENAFLKGAVFLESHGMLAYLLDLEKLLAAAGRQEEDTA